MKTFKYHIDPGHGWLEVSISDLDNLGIRNLISSYSYRMGGVAYLEEDCDMSLFVKAYINRYDCYPNIVNVDYDRDCFIRDYNRYF